MLNETRLTAEPTRNASAYESTGNTVSEQAEGFREFLFAGLAAEACKWELNRKKKPFTLVGVKNEHPGNRVLPRTGTVFNSAEGIAVIELF